MDAQFLVNPITITFVFADTNRVYFRAHGLLAKGILSPARSFLWLSICLASSAILSAISPDDRLSSLSISRWGAPHGIPEETFSALLAPGDGYVWLASNHGLVRFDGQRAQVLRLGDMFRPLGTGSCSISTLSSVLMGPDSNIWVSSTSGCIFHLERDRFGGFANFRLLGMEAPNLDRESAGVLGLRLLPDSNRVEVWRRSRLSTVSPEQFAVPERDRNQPVTRSSAETVTFTPPPGVRLVLTARSPTGRLWALMSDGQLFRSNESGTAWTVRGQWNPGPHVTPMRLIAAASGSVWIGSNRGLFEWKDGAFRTWGVKDGLPSENVLALHEDRAGCVWIGLSKAVARLCRGKVESISLGADQEEMLSAMAEDPQGNIWLGGRWGNLYRLSPAIFQSFTRREGMPESHLTGVTVDRDGITWGSLKEFGLVRIADGRILENVRHPGINESQALVPHPDGGVISASSMGLFRVGNRGVQPLDIAPPVRFLGLTATGWEDDQHLLLSNSAAHYRLQRQPGTKGSERYQSQPLKGPARIRQWARDPSGRTWALAQFEGLYFLDGAEYRPAANRQPERARAWYSLRSDSEGLLWIGTTDGVEIYSTRESRYLTSRPLLFGDQVFHITEDRFGKIWCATRQGLIRFSRARALQIATGEAGESQSEPFYERFGDAQSLPTTNFGLVTSATGATGNDGRIWFPGLLGLVSLQPADFERTPRPPAAALLKLNRDGQAADLNQPLRIAPGHKTLEFLFQTLRLDPLGGDFCRIRMEGFDANWGTCNAQRTAQYTQLPPSEYAFVVQTSSQPGVWNGPVLRVPLVIEPALYQRASVRVGGVVLFLAAICFFLWRRQKQLLERTRWLEEKVDERTATLEKAKHAAEAASRAKSEFLATMSHEIRTPMNGVLGAVQILDDSQLNRDQKKLVSVIRQSGEDLVAIVDDILSLAKVEAGMLSLERAPVQVQSLVETLIALFRPKAESKGVALRYSVDSGVPEYILGDPQRLRQVLLNLVGNAVKFTDRGEVRLRVTADPEKPSITFQVEDTGLGIPAEKIPTLFDPFVQADSSTTRRFGGSGLGLSIVQRFVLAMDGAIEVHSTPGLGSTFRVTLPCEAAQAPPFPAPAETPLAAPPPAASRGITVLLAEDNAVNQMIFQKMLIRLGCEVILARHGKEALEALKTADVDLVLMDCQMPELDGYQTTREIRAWGGPFATLPVIALTASAMAEDRQNCMDAGMNDFLSKPLMFSTLEAALTQWARPDTESVVPTTQPQP